MYGLCQLSQPKRLDRVLSHLEIHYCALGKSGPAMEFVGAFRLPQTFRLQFLRTLTLLLGPLLPLVTFQLGERYRNPILPLRARSSKLLAWNQPEKQVKWRRLIAEQEERGPNAAALCRTACGKHFFTTALDGILHRAAH